MKYYCSLIFILTTLYCNAQYYTPSKDKFYFKPGKRGFNDYFIEGDTLYTESGFKFTKWQTFKLAAGSGANGYFKHIYRLTNEGSGGLLLGEDKYFVKGTDLYFADNVGGTAGLASKQFAGKTMVVVNIAYSGNKRTGYTYSPVLAIPNPATKKGFYAERYFLDYENAVNAGEITYPGKIATKHGSAIEVKVLQPSSTLSITDELIKLKKLLDSGVLTQAEYDAAKKKLLDKI